MAEHMWYWDREPNPDYARLYDDYRVVGRWVYSEKAFHYYLSDNHSYGYPKPLPEGAPPPPDLPPPAGNVGDGGFYGRLPDVQSNPVPEGSDEMSTPLPPGMIPPIPPVKDGIWTTEFWLAMIAQIMPILVLLHVIPTGDANTVTGELNAIVQGVFATVVPAVALWKYISGRVAVKTAAIQSLPLAR